MEMINLFTVYIKCADDQTADIVRPHETLIQATTSSSAVHVVTTMEPPEGCAIQSVSINCQTYLMLKVGDHSPFLPIHAAMTQQNGALLPHQLQSIRYQV